MLLSNRWGKSEGDHIVLHSLKINYSCSSYLLSTILFMSLFCLFLGIRTMWLAQSCNPVLLLPLLMLMQLWFSCRVLAQAQASSVLRPTMLYIMCTDLCGIGHQGVPGRKDTTDYAVSVDGCFIKRMLLSQLALFTTNTCCNSSSATSHT